MKMITAHLRTVLAAALAAGLWSGMAVADMPGASDHPLLGRYEGAEIVGYAVQEDGQTRILEGPFAPAAADLQRGPGFNTLAGRITLIYYRLPYGASSLQVMRTYEAIFRMKAAHILFSCTTYDGTCYLGRVPDAGYYLGSAIGSASTLPKLAGEPIHGWFDKGGFYMLARLDLQQGIVYAALFLGESPRGNVAVLRVIETQELARDPSLFMDAMQMQEALAARGRVNLYGIPFDDDDVAPRPEGRPTLDEIARLMTVNPALKLQVVVHTDYKGTEAYNLELSARRAQRVIAALLEDHAIAAERLSPRGAGFEEPVASNDTEDGREQNRRVELVTK